jgi:hypothetical protein
LTDELWALRRSKLCLRRQLQRSQRAVSRESLARVFQCWRLQHLCELGHVADLDDLS